MSRRYFKTPQQLVFGRDVGFKMAAWRNTAVVVFVALLATFWAKESQAGCDCMPSHSAKEAFSESSAVFEGRVLAAQLMPGQSMGSGSTPRMQRIKFRVLRGWKGVYTPTVEVFTAENAANCGRKYKSGKEYLVYSIKPHSYLEDNICSRSSGDPTKIMADKAELGRPDYENENAGPANSERVLRPSGRCRLSPPAWADAVYLLGLAGFFAWRRRGFQ